MFRVMFWKVAEEVTDEKAIGFVAAYPRFALFTHIKNGEHPHYHAYVETGLSMPTFRARFKKAFKLEKHQHSIQQCDPVRIDEYLQYCMHIRDGNQPQCIAHNIGDERIAEATLKAKTATERFKAAKQAKDEQITIIQIIDEVTRWANDNIEWGHRTWGEFPEPDRRKLLEKVIETHNKHRKAYCEYSLCKVYDSVLGRCRHKHVRDDLINRLMIRTTPRDFSH